MYLKGALLSAIAITASYCVTSTSAFASDISTTVSLRDTTSLHAKKILLAFGMFKSGPNSLYCYSILTI